jgi:hypothetical protein
MDVKEEAVSTFYLALPDFRQLGEGDELVLKETWYRVQTLAAFSWKMCVKAFVSGKPNAGSITFR